jgi:hypothetical protein
VFRFTFAYFACRLFADELSCVAFCGGATESLKCNNVL